jgi:hypothetical protein
MPVRRRSPSAEVVLAEPIVEGEVLSPGITRIIKLEASTSEDQWELARLYAEECENKSLRKVARLVRQPHLAP